ncbi:ribbon-helix-helix protein, CopG family [Sinomonas humi]|uniref:CopG family transcriptional regulator n=1 Tax=Sinomonas humi TaxID=1338436 RepID=A0A0B2A9H9_9MICC|nr:ribbon-helix-helix protein, CopG family [Sinomonas humi]KHL00229.1 CopG family transcriptional regulator [Sinomonas humi]
MASPESRIDTHLTRLSINMNPETAATLKKLAQQEGLSQTEVIRRAVALMEFIQDERRHGRKIQTMDSNDKNKRELVLV